MSGNSPTSTVNLYNFTSTRIKIKTTIHNRSRKYDDRETSINLFELLQITPQIQQMKTKKNIVINVINTRIT